MSSVPSVSSSGKHWNSLNEKHYRALSEWSPTGVLSIDSIDSSTAVDRRLMHQEMCTHTPAADQGSKVG